MHRNTNIFTELLCEVISELFKFVVHRGATEFKHAIRSVEVSSFGLCWQLLAWLEWYRYVLLYRSWRHPQSCPTYMTILLALTKKYSSKPRKVLAKVLLLSYEFLRTFCTRKFGREWHVEAAHGPRSDLDTRGATTTSSTFEQHHGHSTRFHLLHQPTTTNHLNNYHTIQSYSYNRIWCSVIDHQSSGRRVNTPGQQPCSIIVWTLQHLPFLILTA